MNLRWASTGLRLDFYSAYSQKGAQKGSASSKWASEASSETLVTRRGQDTETATDTDTETETGTDVGIETETESETDTETDTETETETGTSTRLLLDVYFCCASQ